MKAVRNHCDPSRSSATLVEAGWAQWSCLGVTRQNISHLAKASQTAEIVRSTVGLAVDGP